MLSAEFVIKRAASARNNGGTEYDNGERNKKVFYAESILNVVDKVRKERLLGNLIVFALYYSFQHNKFLNL